MNYKYKKRQIFGKRLKVPKNILSKVYNSTLSFSEFIEYELEDKIPISCLLESQRQIVEKVGIEKAKTIEWELISLKDLVRNWDLYKDKDLSYCLQNDYFNKFNITDNQLKEFMDTYESISSLILNNADIYSLIDNIVKSENVAQEKQYIKQITDKCLANLIRKERYAPNEISNNEYREIFKYSSIEDYLKQDIRYNQHYMNKILDEIKILPEEYIYNMTIPFSMLKNRDVISFIGTYGIKNIVDFDNECGHFFTKNNCEMLELMNSMYLHYASNEHDENKTIYTRKMYDENGDYIDRPYTKDEFYEAMRRMIKYGPSDWSYNDKAPDYREITGEFRKRNSDLFISEQAPEELKKLFYTKSIIPQHLVENPEFIPYLNGKDLSSCFKIKEIYVKYSDSSYGYENFYNFLGEKAEFNTIMKYITAYSDILGIALNESMSNFYEYRINFSKDDSFDVIKEKVNAAFKRIVIEKGICYSNDIPQEVMESNSSIFLKKDAPQELQEVFYNRNINTDFILSNPNYEKYLKDVDLEVIYKYMPVSIIKENERAGTINLISAIKNVVGNEECFNIMKMYGKYIETAFETNKLIMFDYNPNFKEEDLLNELNSSIYESIIHGDIKYDDKMPEYFKSNNPTLFLDKSVSQDISNKFYNREFTIDDFNSNPELLKVFGKTNVVCGFSEDVAWMIPLFNDKDSNEANRSRLKIISAYSKIQDYALKESFKEYVMEFSEHINLEKIEYVSSILSRLSLSNSSEIYTFRKELATQLLKSNNPIESLNKIEDIFIGNYIPTFGKIYSCFDILHPDFEGFDFKNSSISPTLKKSSNIRKKVTVFSDLVKASLGSNNMSVKNFLDNIETGNNLYEQIKSGQVEYDSLEESEKNKLISFSKILSTIHNNTMKNRTKNELFNHTENVVSDISQLAKKLSADGNMDYNLGDRVIRMFLGFTGINTIKQAKEYIASKISNADSRNRIAANSEMILEQGDFIKGIGNIKYLGNILQNGSVSKEFLGESATSDATPLDADVSMITESDGTNYQKIKKTAAADYGPIYFVLKNDDRFITTRTENELLDIPNDMSKMEVFYTGALGKGHYGIRTGFPSSEIDYIVVDKYDERIGLEIAMNGFYIPVADINGKIIFTPKEYDNMRAKMTGLSYYGQNDYIFSENLVNDETEYIASQIDKNECETQEKKIKICKTIEESLDKLGLKLKTKIDGDLTEGFVEFIDTGSTGRGTNKIGDGDFDFIMRLDNSILSDSSKSEELKQNILKSLGKENTSEVIDTGDFRLKGVKIDTENNVDIDITFSKKTDKIAYSTDMAIQDRLNTIKKSDPDKYKYVIANIILAKQVLKQANAYKPNRGEIPQGGLGGVGVENWILQNGGSFMDAAKSFIKASEGKSFDEFKESYYIWDFGENYIAERRGVYYHDNFIADNMSNSGYEKMTEALKEYVKSHSKSVKDLAKESFEEQKDVELLNEIECDQERQMREITRQESVQSNKIGEIYDRY